MFKISVVITNWNRHQYFDEILEQLNDQQYPKDMFEVIIVDDNSLNKNEFPSMIKKFRKTYDFTIRAFETHKNITHNPAVRFNVGIRHAEGDIVIINESDIIMEGNYLNVVNRYHQDQDKIWLYPSVYRETGGNVTLESLRGFVDLGGSCQIKYLFQITGFDERTRGWGGIESDLNDRLQQIGVNPFKCPELSIKHRDWPSVGKCAGPSGPGGQYPWPPKNGVAPNDSSWGNPDSLEEL